VRYERKYRIENLDYDSIYHELNVHAAGFSVQYPDRQIHSIYFDDADFRMARATLAGISNRCKYRLRWYGENERNIMSPRLEIKIKSNQLGFKNLKQLPELDLDLNFREYCEEHVSKELPIFHQKLRVTIDRAIEYRGIDNYQLGMESQEDSAIVVEFKYDKQDALSAEDMMNMFPFRLGKNSKYVNAVKAFWI